MIKDFASKLKDPGQDLAPPDGVAPDFGRIKKGFQLAVSDCGDVINQGRLNYETRYALWSGQSSDGKKHNREGPNAAPTPWDGASDLRVWLADEAINAKVAQDYTAFKRSNVVAVPIEGTDMARAKAVTSFMKWLIYTQIPQVDREVELLAQYRHEKGSALLGVFWETCQDKTLENIRVETLAQQYPEIEAMLKEPALEPVFIDMMKGAYDISDKKAKKMLKELREDGETTVPVVGPEYSRPVIRAFTLDKDVFIHPSATDIENAPGIYRVQYHTPEQLRSYVVTEGWNAAWVEEAIQRCKGRVVSMLPDSWPEPISRNVINQAARFTDLIGVVYAYERLVDEDGVPGIYLSVFNPDLPPANGGAHNGYAKFGLLGYKHGKYPFVLFRREYLSRRLHDTRGIPEIAKPYQDTIKACSDGRIDAMSISILPPLMYPTGRPITSWGAGARIPYRRDPKEYQFADRPAYDINTTVVEEKTTARFHQYFGMASPDGDPVAVQTQQQHEINRWLSSWSDVFRQCWALYQQYGSDSLYFRVIGVSSQEMVNFQKGDPKESYDFYLNFDVQTNDPEQMEGKMKGIAQIVNTFDRNGQTDFAELLSWALSAYDPALAERVIQPKEAATQKAVEEYQTLFAKAFAGVDVDYKEGMPAELGLQVLQGYLQAPDVQQRAQSDENFRGRLEKLQKQMQFQITQRENAQIGRLGA